jgi:hypothetical protein
VLANTDVATRRLRNTTYTAGLQELSSFQQSIDELNSSVMRFNQNLQNISCKLTQTLTQLEEWNDYYINNPPTNDISKDKYQKLQYNLLQRNRGIVNLLKIMKRVSDKNLQIDTITSEINEINDFSDREYANIEYVITE